MVVGFHRLWRGEGGAPGGMRSGLEGLAEFGCWRGWQVLRLRYAPLRMTEFLLVRESRAKENGAP